MNQATDIVERDWWKLFQQGDMAAFKNLYQRYFHRLFSYGQKLCHSPEILEDALQDFFMKLMRNRENLVLPDSVQAYMLGAFRMFLTDKLKQYKSRLQKEIPAEGFFEFGEIHDSVMIKELDAEQQQLLQDALNQLTARQREAIYLRYFEGLDYEALARLLELSQKGTYKLIGRAVGAMREHVEKRMLAISPIVILFLPEIFTTQTG